MEKSTLSIPIHWNEIIQKQQWYRLTPLLYEHLDEQQNRDVLKWIDFTARSEGHVPLWYFHSEIDSNIFNMS